MDLVVKSKLSFCRGFAALRQAKMFHLLLIQTVQKHLKPIEDI